MTKSSSDVALMDISGDILPRVRLIAGSRVFAILVVRHGEMREDG